MLRDMLNVNGTTPGSNDSESIFEKMCLLWFSTAEST